MERASKSVAPRGVEPVLPFAVRDLTRVEAPPTDVFARRHVRPRVPVIVTGLLDGWLPAAEWTFERMASRHGAARVVAAVLQRGTLLDDPAQGVVFEHVALREFVASTSRPGAASHYVMAPTWNFPASFADDYRVPPYCAGAPHLRAKVWLGKAGTVTPMHRDVPHNLHVHLSGRKRWLLFPPGGAAMYPRGVLSGMPNFSQVDPERPDWERHPRFRAATAYGATIEPGEALFIPHGWWHHTRSLDDAVSMNFWWGGTLIALAARASGAFKRARGIRQNEWA